MNELYHYGVLGMKWGVRRNRQSYDYRGKNKVESLVGKSAKASSDKAKKMKILRPSFMNDVLESDYRKIKVNGQEYNFSKYYVWHTLDKKKNVKISEVYEFNDANIEGFLKGKYDASGLYDFSFRKEWERNKDGN